MLTIEQKREIKKQYKKDTEFSKDGLWLFDQKVRDYVNKYYHNAYIPFELEKISKKFTGLRYNCYHSNGFEISIYSFFVSLAKGKYELDTYKETLKNTKEYIKAQTPRFGTFDDHEEINSAEYLIEKITPIIAKKEYEKLDRELELKQQTKKKVNKI